MAMADIETETRVGPGEVPMLDDVVGAVAVSKDRSSSRNRILDAAEELIGEQGYAATSISAVCSRSGLPVGSVYHHFGNKAGLLRAVVDRAAERFLDAAAAIDDPADNPEQRLERLYRAAPDLVLCNAGFLRIWNSSLGRLDGDLPEYFGRTADLVGTVVADALRPVAERAGVADPAGLADRLARLTLTYTRGALLESDYDPQVMRASMALLAEAVQAAITFAAAQGRDAPAPA